MGEGKRKRILLVDDDEALLLTVTDCLVSDGFEVVQARNGLQALSRIAERAPDLIVLDLNMPTMGGIEFLKRIQTPNGTLKYPTLIFTVRSAMEKFFGGIAVDGFVAKPCSGQELLAQIRQVLRRRNTRRSAPPARTAGCWSGKTIRRAPCDCRRRLPRPDTT